MTCTSDTVWNYFKKSSERKTDSIKTKQQYFLATCNYCETTLSGQPKRMKAHLKNCPNVPSEIKEKYSPNPENKEQEINPKYNPPSKKVLLTNLLKKEYKQISTDVKKLVKNVNYICLTSDGWTNIHQESVINFMVTTPQPIFWKALETKESSHTGKYIAYQFEIVIEEIGISKIAAIITDNASNMKKAHKILLTKYPKIIFLGNNFN